MLTMSLLHVFRSGFVVLVACGGHSHSATRPLSHWYTYTSYPTVIVLIYNALKPNITQNNFLIAVVSFSTVSYHHSISFPQPFHFEPHRSHIFFLSHVSSYLRLALIHRPFHTHSGVHNSPLFQRRPPPILHLRWPSPRPQLCLYRHRQFVRRVVHETYGEVLVVGGVLWSGDRGGRRFVEFLVRTI